MEPGTHDIRPLPFRRDWGVGAPSCLMITFQRASAQVEKYAPPGICKTGKRL